MFGAVQYTPCEHCGVMIPIQAQGIHDCDLDKLVVFQVGLFERQFRDFLDTPQGLFEQDYAERTR